MKKIFFSWMSILLMAFVCVTFTACGSDDDDNVGGPGDAGGSKVMSLNGQTYSLGYGFWDAGHNQNTLSIEFSNYNLANLTSLPTDRIDVLYFNIDGLTSLQSGTYTTKIEIYSWNAANEGIKYPGGYGMASVIISQSGSNYTITIPETTVNYVDPNTNTTSKVPFSFNWTGGLIHYDFDED